MSTSQPVPSKEQPATPSFAAEEIGSDAQDRRIFAGSVPDPAVGKPKAYVPKKVYSPPRRLDNGEEAGAVPGPYAVQGTGASSHNAPRRTNDYQSSEDQPTPVAENLQTPIAAMVVEDEVDVEARVREGLERQSKEIARQIRKELAQSGTTGTGDRVNESIETNGANQVFARAGAEEEEKKYNWWCIGGIIGGVVCLLILIIVGVVVSVVLGGGGGDSTKKDSEGDTETGIYTLSIEFDSYPYENSWTLYDYATGITLFEEIYDESFTYVVWEVEMTLVEGVQYQLVVRDSAEDGLNDLGGPFPGRFAFYRGTVFGTLLWSVDYGEAFSLESFTFVA